MKLEINLTGTPEEMKELFQIIASDKEQQKSILDESVKAGLFIDGKPVI